jgi:predicted RNA-binding protein with RPS1 domain
MIRGATSAILHPKIITYDFETDTHTNIHIPNHVEVDILQIDENKHMIMTNV